MRLRARCTRGLLLGATVLAAIPTAYAQSATASSAPVTHHARRHAHHAAAQARPTVAAPATAAGTAAPPASGNAARNAAVVSQGAGNASMPAPKAESVVVTGTLFRDPNLVSASPITRLTSTQLQQRGIKTVTDALQLLSSNGAGNLTNAFSANGAFAAGASAPSLRGLGTSSTLVMMDGMRLSYYPLADDGTRDFVDTNWMPASIMDRIDVQEDGGSAIYGADAVAGVVNMITRQQIKGFEGNAEGGLAQGGYGGHTRLYATYGIGDLDHDGYNFYVNSEYQEDDTITNNQVGYPYNTSNLTGIGGGNANYNLLSNGNINNLAQTKAVEAYAADSSGNALSGYNLLNPSAGCGSIGPAHTGYVTGTPAGSSSTVCESNSVKNGTNSYQVVQPYDRRVEATAHLTVNIGSRAQLTSMFTYSQNLVTFTGSQYSGGEFYANTQSELGTSEGVLAPAVLPNGQLNPNDPYAASGQSAQLYGLLDEPTTTTEFSQNYRGSMHLTGWEPSKWGGDWNYDSSFVGMNTDLAQTYTGYINVADLDNAIQNGTYNFVDQSANSQAARNAIAPPDEVHDKTQEYSWQATLSKGLVRLPGGMLNLAIGTNVRYESLLAVDANPVNVADPNDQYESINPVSAQGHRWVESGYFELNAPIVKMLNADFQGRYDAYSTGFSHFSPKIGVEFKPFKEFQLRGTWSEGFQVPSFSQTSGSSIGYVGAAAPTNEAWLAQHSTNGTPNTYAQAYSLGLETVGNPNLKPETNNTFTGGPVFHPLPWITLGATYYYINEHNVIVANPTPYSTVANAYAAANTSKTMTIDGDTVIPDVADPQNPTGARRAGIIESSYINANSLVTDGVDLSLSFNHRLPGFLHDVQWFSAGRATWVHRYNESVPGVGVERFAGSEGPWQQVSASGTPRWRANWQNTFTWKKLSSTLTVYYTGGYHAQADDATGAGSVGNCALSLYSSVSSFYPSQCNVRHFWDIDLTENYQFTKRIGVYVNIYNLAGFKSPYDYGTYGSYLYNSSWAQNGVIGRAFRFGVNMKL